MHERITEVALACLPARCRRLFGKEAGRFCAVFANYPDLLNSPDSSRNTEIDPVWETFFPDPAQNHLTESDYAAREPALTQARFYISSAVRALRRNDLPCALKLMGCLAHFIEDSAQPLHTFPYSRLLDLLPAPPKFFYVDMHARTERGLKIAPADIPGIDYTPRLLGLDEQQALFHFRLAFERSLKEATARIIPITQAVYRGDDPTARALTIELYLGSARFVADAIVTICSLADGPAPASERKRLARFDLTRLDPEPDSWFGVHHENARAVYGVCINVARPGLVIVHEKEKRQTVPMALLTGWKRRTFKTGINVLPWRGRSQLNYRLLPGAYRRLAVLAGLHPDIGARGRVCFKIVGDGKTLYESGPVTGRESARNIQIDIARVKILSLLVEDRQAEPADFRFNSAVWAEPLLLR